MIRYPDENHCCAVCNICDPAKTYSLGALAIFTKQYRQQRGAFLQQKQYKSLCEADGDICIRTTASTQPTHDRGISWRVTLETPTSKRNDRHCAAMIFTSASNSMQVLFVEVGFGCDGHGQNVTVSCSKPPCMKVYSFLIMCSAQTAAIFGPENTLLAESSHQSLQECH